MVMKKLLPWLAILSPLPALVLYSPYGFPDLLDPYSLSTVLGVMAFSWFHMVLIISSRIKFLDRIFGHDKVMQFHGTLAVTALVTALAHRQLKVSIFPFTNTQVLLGTIGLTTLVVILSATILFMVPGLIHRIRWLDRLRRWVNTTAKADYSWLKLLHNGTVVALILLSIHVILASSTQASPLNLVYMALLATLSLASWLRHRILRPWTNGKKGYRVSEIIPLGNDVTEVRITGDRPAPLPDYHPGQFAFFRFPFSPAGNDEHPFTISSSPKDPFIAFTAKNLGNFTSRLRNLKPGTPVAIDGPYGSFTIPEAPSPVPHDLLLIAGGIGITPFLSMILHGHIFTQGRVTLLWGARTTHDLHYDQVFRRIQEQRGPDHFTYLPILSHQDPGPGQSGGFITQDLIMNHITSPTTTEVYLCGPPPMRHLVLRALKALGIPKKRLHYEQFSL